MPFDTATPTDRPPEQALAMRRRTVAFLLAHQDDELMLSPLITASRRDGHAIAVVYLTNGDGGGPTAVRNRESANFLAALGVEVESETVFVGTALSISDGTLHQRLDAAHEAVMDALRDRPPTAAIYVHAWEGGNPDHDAACALALGVARALGIGGEVIQVPFYRAPRRGPLPFLLYAPLAANGPVRYHRLSLAQRIRRLLDLRHFPSQLAGLGRLLPLMIVDAVVRPGVALQSAVPSRLFERPMPEPLRYERLNYVAFDDLARSVARYWQAVAARPAPVDTATVDETPDQRLRS